MIQLNTITGYLKVYSLANNDIELILQICEMFQIQLSPVSLQLMQVNFI